MLRICLPIRSAHDQYTARLAASGAWPVAWPRHRFGQRTCGRPFAFLVPSLGGTAGDGGNLGYTVFLVLFGSFFVALVGAIVGVIAGALASSGVYLALRLAVRIKSDAPAGVVRMLGGAAGGAIAGAVLVMVVVRQFPLTPSISVLIVITMIVVAAGVAVAQGAAIERMRR